MASFLLQTGRKFDEAKELASKAVEMEPMAKNYFLLSVSCERTGDLAGASSAAKQAIAVEPYNEQYQKLNQRLQRLIRIGAPNESD